MAQKGSSGESSATHDDVCASGTSNCDASEITAREGACMLGSAGEDKDIPEKTEKEAPVESRTSVSCENERERVQLLVKKFQGLRDRVSELSVADSPADSSKLQSPTTEERVSRDTIADLSKLQPPTTVERVSRDKSLRSVRVTMPRVSRGLPRFSGSKERKSIVAKAPLGGELIICISSSAIIFAVFFAELIYNKLTFNGRCVSSVLYAESSKEVQPHVVDLGYGACEVNLKTEASKRVFYGQAAADDGYPTDIVKNGKISASSANWDSPNYRIFEHLGALDTNKIRNYKENFRLFWSVFMHFGWIHLLFNVFLQFNILWIIEPDWGFLRTLLLFFVSGLCGNLVAAVYSPCTPLVGSSGVMFGALGALVPYCIESWNYLTNILPLAGVSVFVVILGVFVQDSYATSNRAHIGGYIAGLLWGLSTVKSVAILDRCKLMEWTLLRGPFSRVLSEERKNKLRESLERKSVPSKDPRRSTHISEMAPPNWRERLKNAFRLWPKTPRKTLIRDYITRIFAALLLVSMIVYLMVALYSKDVYTGMDRTSSAFFSQSCHCCTIKGAGDQKQYRNVVGTEGFYWCFSSRRAAELYCNPRDMSDS